MGYMKELWTELEQEDLEQYFYENDKEFYDDVVLQANTIINKNKIPLHLVIDLDSEYDHEFQGGGSYE